MSAKKVLVVILVAVSFCFVSGVVYGEIPEWMDELPASYMDVQLLRAMVGYTMRNPTTFLMIDFTYDSTGTLYKDRFPRLMITKGKIIVTVYDVRDIFTNKSGTALLDSFKKVLEVAYSFIQHVSTDMNADVLAIFKSGSDIPLGYFYRGQYYLW